MSGWYELSKSSNDQFKFFLKAGNVEVFLLVSYTVQKVVQAMVSGQFKIIPKTNQNFPK
jgi:hypothetical protein